MGPTILFDKSAIQALGRKHLSVVNRYFCRLTPPVLLLETLADLSKKSKSDAEVSQTVKDISRNLLPVGTPINADWRTMCIANLLGHEIPMDRVPKPLAEDFVEIATPELEGIFSGVQRENEAVSRWRRGNFSDDDRQFAIDWRKNATGYNLEEAKNVLPEIDADLCDADEVARFIDIILNQEEMQSPMLDWFLDRLECEELVREQVHVRWKIATNRSFKKFAPYTYHCIRLQLIFFVGMRKGVFGTRSSNVIDIEYFCYSPFASIFCSGDNLHERLSPVILDADQTFVDVTELQTALREIATAREENPDAVPNEESLIQKLWKKHWGKEIEHRERKKISAEENRKLLEKIKPLAEAFKEAQGHENPKRRFPL